MELKQLEYFIAVSEELHFTKAAERLGITQPSLSQQIKLLEHEAGMPLFDRIGKKTVLTEAGTILLKHSYNVLHELRQARSAIGELQGLRRGTLRIGSLHSAVHRLMPAEIMRFHEQHPGIRLDISALSQGDIMSGLLRNELDLGLAYMPLVHEELEAEPLYAESPALALPAGHPMSELKQARIGHLHGEATIELQENYYFRQYVDKLCREHNVDRRPAVQLNTLESIIGMVSVGTGVAVLPSGYLRSLNHPGIAVVPFEEPALDLQVGICYRRNKFLCAASRAFLEQVRSGA